MLNAEQSQPVCYNNRVPPADGYWAQTRRYVGKGMPYFLVDEFIPFRMKRECGQDGSHLPCHGCEYLEVKE